MHFLSALPGGAVLLFFLIALSFFFSASETSIIALSKIRLKHMVAKGIKHSQSIQNLISKSDSFITGILIGNNFVNIAISAIVTAASIDSFGHKWGVVIATFIAFFFVLILCEITPKILAIKHTERIALFTAPFMEIFIKVFYPVINFFAAVGNSILKLFKIAPAKRSPLITEEELRLMIEVGREEGVLSDEERKMLHRIFEFGDIKVRDVMVPKEKIAGVDLKTSSEELLNIFVEEGHARLAVYDGLLDNIVGIVHASDLLYIIKNKGLFLLQDLLHKPYVVLGSMRVNELLRVFQVDKIQIAIVVDEHKKTLGLVTLEDLIEEIVGEIEEEKRKPFYKKK